MNIWMITKNFYSSLNMKQITDTDYKLPKRGWQDLRITNLGKYHNFYAQGDTLLEPDVFENFQKNIKIHGIDPAYFRSAPRLAWQTALKKSKVRLELLIDINVIDDKKSCTRRNMSYYPLTYRK